MQRRTLLSYSLAAAVPLVALTVCTAPAQAAQPVLNVAYAGVMGPVMDKALGPAIAKQEHVQYEGQGAGAYGLARLIASKQINPDVFISITPGPIRVLQKAGLVSTAVPIASTEMVIAYSPQSAFAKDFEAAAKGGEPWYAVLQKPGMKFGRTDPAVDPQGRNIIFTMLLAEKFYKQPGLMQKILGPIENPQQIFTEPSLLARLQSGQIDASSGYLCAAISHHLPYVTLPPQINLSDPAMVKAYYDKVHFSIKLPNGKTDTLSTQPLVFYAAVLKNAPNPKAGEAFVQLMTSAQGQSMFKDMGYGPPVGTALK
jgi:molybdate/tungstate transport system substrate-binding protein